MAQTDLTIKLKVDTTEAGKLELVTKSFSENSVKLAELEKARNAILAQQNKEYFALKNMIDKANIAISDGAKGANLGIMNTTRAAEKLTASYANTLPILKKLNEEIDNLSKKSSTSTAARPIPLGTNAPITSPGLSSNIPTATQLENQAKAQQSYYAEITRLNDAFTAKYLAGLQRRAERGQTLNRATQADYNRLFGALTPGTLTRSTTGQQSQISADMVRGMSAGTVAARAAASALNNHATASNAAETAHKGLILRIIEGVSIYKLYNFTLNTVINSLKSIPNIGIELESTQASLTATAGGMAGAASVMMALEAEAKRTGISISTLRETFRGFQASTSLAGESIESTWHMFSNLNTVITGLHLPAGKAQGIFLAMAQIFNKTKVQSEELVKQLGNLLPGAFASFAAANKDMFTNSGQLIAAMKNGVVFAHDTVEKFTQYLADRFAPAFALASQGLNANIGHMQTSFTLLGEAIYKLSSGAMLSVIQGLTTTANYLKDAVTGANNFGKYVTIAFNLGVIAISAYMAQAAKAIILSNALVVSMRTVGVTTTLAAVATQKLGTAISFLKANPIIAIATAVVSLGMTLKAAGQTEEDNRVAAEKWALAMTEVHAATKEVTLAMKIANDPMVVAGNLAVQQKETEIAHLKLLEKKGQHIIAINGHFYNLSKYIIAAQTELKSFNEKLLLANKNAVITLEIESDQALLDLSTFQNKMKIAALEAAGKFGEAAALQFESINASDLAKTQKNIDALASQEEQLKSIVQNRSVYQQEEVLKAQNKLEQLGDLRTSLANAEIAKNKAIEDSNSKITKAQSDAYKEINLVRAEDKAAKEAEIAEAEEQYARKNLSLSSYFSKRNEIITRHTESETFLAREGQKQAAILQDTSKVDEFRSIELQAISDAKKAYAELEKDKYNAQNAYKNTVIDVYATEIELTRTLEEGNKIRIANEYELKRRSFEAAALEGDLQAQAMLKSVNLQEKYALSAGAVKTAFEKTSLEAERFSAKSERINTELAAGLISQLQAQEQINDAKVEYIRVASISLSSLDKETLTLQQQNELLLQRQALDKERFSGLGASQTILSEGTPSWMSEAEQRQGLLAKEQVSIDFLPEGDIKLEAVRKHALAVKETYLDMFTGIASTGATTFSELTAASSKMFGEQSIQAKASFAIYKTLKAAEIIMSTASLAMKLAESGASVPFIGPALAAAGPPMAIAMGAVQLAMLATAPMPQAHAGLDYVPEDQTYLLKKGERVVAPEQNRDLTSALQKSRNQANSGGITIGSINVTVESKDNTSSTEQANEIGKAIQIQLKTLITSELVAAKRSGGTLNPTQLTTAF